MSFNDSNTATVSINVTDQAPVATDIGPLSVLHGTSVAVSLASNVSDPDGETPTASVVLQPTHGSLFFDSWTNQYYYTPTGTYIGADSFTFKANDTVLDSNVATVSINVTDQAPVATGIGPLSVLQGDSVPISLVGNVSDPDGDALNISVVQQPTHGSLFFDSYSNQYYYTANGTYTGPDSFTFKANDGVLDGNVATASINVTDEASELYAAYLAAVAQADQVLRNDAQDLVTSTQSLIDSSQASTQAAVDQLYITYLTAVSSAQDYYQTAHDQIVGIYTDAVNQASTTNVAQVNAALAVYDDALTAALLDLDQAMQASETQYEQAQQSADAAYQSAISPYQAQLDDAAANAAAHPNDTDAQAALAQAQQDFDNAESAAAAVQAAAYANADSAKTAADAAAAQAVTTAIDSADSTASTSVNAADQDFAMAVQSAWSTATSNDDLAQQVYIQAEADAWDTYQAALTIVVSQQQANLAGIQVAFNSSVNDDLAIWQGTENAAWSAYTAALSEEQPEQPPGPRQDPPAFRWSTDYFPYIGSLERGNAPTPLQQWMIQLSLPPSIDTPRPVELQGIFTHIPHP